MPTSIATSIHISSSFLFIYDHVNILTYIVIPWFYTPHLILTRNTCDKDFYSWCDHANVPVITISKQIIRSSFRSVKAPTLRLDTFSLHHIEQFRSFFIIYFFFQPRECVLLGGIWCNLIFVKPNKWQNTLLYTKLNSYNTIFQFNASGLNFPIAMLQEDFVRRVLMSPNFS